MPGNSTALTRCKYDENSPSKSRKVVLADVIAAVIQYESEFCLLSTEGGGALNLTGYQRNASIHQTSQRTETRVDLRLVNSTRVYPSSVPVEMSILNLIRQG